MNNQWFHAVNSVGHNVARVVVVGAGIAGLSAAIHAVSSGHHVVVLEKRSKIGGRGTSQNVDGFSLHYGPHLFDKTGPFFQMCKKLSRVKPKIKSLRLDKVEVAGFGPIRPVGNVKQAALNRRSIKLRDSENPFYQAIEFLSSWGIEQGHGRIKSVIKSKLSASNEGWIGLIGRLSATLDEIGVLIETNCEVTSIKGQEVFLRDGRNFSCDAIILACGANSARRVLQDIDAERTDKHFATLQTHFASCIEAGLSSKPMSGRQCIIDLDNDAAIFDYSAIQPRLGVAGSHISAILVKDDGEHGLLNLAAILDRHISGWSKHIVADLQQSKIIIGYSNCLNFDTFADYRIMLAGAWVESHHMLADAAADTGKRAAQTISSILS